MKKRFTITLLMLLFVCLGVACGKGEDEVVDKDDSALKETTNISQSDANEKNTELKSDSDKGIMEETSVQEETTAKTKDNKKDVPTVENHYYNTNGELYEVIHYNYDDRWNLISTNTIDKDGNLEQISEYDLNGNEIRRINYFGTTTHENIFEYNSQNAMIHEKISDYDTKELISEIWYNDKGQLIEAIYMEYERHVTTEIDEYGNVTLEKRDTYDDMGQIGNTIEIKTEYEYDSKGCVTKKTEYDKKGKKDVEYIYKYDENGNMISQTETSFNEDGNEIDYTHYTYEEGVLTYSKEEAVSYDESEVIEVWYDEKGQVGEYIKRLGGRIYSSGKYIYENDRIVRYEEYYAKNWLSENSPLNLVLERQYQTVDIGDN